jgi:hypothetical protein
MKANIDGLLTWGLIFLEKFSQGSKGSKKRSMRLADLEG